MTLLGLFVTLQHYLLPPSVNEGAEKVQNRVQLRRFDDLCPCVCVCEKIASCGPREGYFHLHRLMKVSFRLNVLLKYDTQPLLTTHTHS